jgi:hypothetical protein
LTSFGTYGTVSLGPAIQSRQDNGSRESSGVIATAGVPGSGFLVRRSIGGNARRLLLFVVTVVAVSAHADLSLRLDEEAVVVSGATPGQQLVVYGIWHSEENYAGVITRRDDVLTADASGGVRWAIPEGVSPRSLWFAADLQTGAVAVTAPDEFPLRRVDVPATVVTRKDLIEALEIPFAYAEILFLRPGEGAWTLSANRGGSNDLKAKREAITVDPRVLRGLKSNGSGPDKVKHGDVIIVIEPYGLRFFSVRWDR